MLSNNIQNIIDTTPPWLENYPSYIKIAVNYSSIGLGYTIFMTIMINIFLIWIIFNLKTEYTWQKNAFVLLLFAINIFYFIHFYTTFLTLLSLFILLIIISSWKFIKNIYQDYMLQRVQDIKFKNLTKRQTKKSKKITIQEAFETNITLWIQLLLEHIEKEYWPLWVIYLWLLITIILNIIILFAYIYIMYGSAYFIK